MRAADIRARVAAILAEQRVATLAHCGAHDGEETPGYLAAGVPRIILIEPLPQLAAALRDRYAADPRVTVVQAACSDRAGVATLTVPARTNMASLVGGDGEQITVPTRRLDNIAPDADAAVIDVQGHEMQVLAAAPWDSLRLVVVETLHGVDDPTLSPPHAQVAAFMTGQGFREHVRLCRDYDWIQRWAYGRTTSTGAEVRDVVFVKDPADA